MCPVEERIGSSVIRIQFLDGPRASEPDMTFDGLNQIVIGRAVDCHVLLPMPEVSHHHARLVDRGGRWVIVDSSRTGTWLNGQRVTGEAVVAGGDTLTIGAQTLRLDLPAENTLPRVRRALSSSSSATSSSGAASATRIVQRMGRQAGPAQPVSSRSASPRAVRAAVASVPRGELPGPEALDELPRSVIIYWYVHAWRLYQQVSAQMAKRTEGEEAVQRAAEQGARLQNELDEARARESRLAERVQRLERELEETTRRLAEERARAASGDVQASGLLGGASMDPEAKNEATEVSPPADGVDGDLAEGLAQLKTVFQDFQALVNRLADRLDPDLMASSGAGEVMGEMSGLLLSMEYLIEGLRGAGVS